MSRRSFAAWSAGKSNADLPLATGEEPPTGAHLVTPRRGYLHHGIYVGEGRVIHYTARAFCLVRRPVEEVSLERFAHRKVVWVRVHAPGSYEPAEIIQRARSRLGEDRYRLFTNNCEHFCEWCTRGLHRSAQVETLRAILGSLRHVPAGRTTQSNSLI
jgi:hypothetical protein